MDRKKLEGRVSVPVKLYPWWVYLKNPEGSRFPFFPFCLFFFLFLISTLCLYIYVGSHSIVLLLPWKLIMLVELPTD